MLIRSEFGQRLLQARKHAGLRQKDVAEAVGMGQSNVALLEKTANGSSHTAAMSALCGVNAMWLETGQGEMLGGGTGTLTLKPIAHADQYDVLAQRREFMLSDIGDLLTQFKTASELRTVHTRVLACITQYTAELTTP